MDHLAGMVWAGFLGLVIGNFATSPIYRLPRKKALFIEDPFCDHCHAKLMPRDLFPVFSWLSTRGKCRYCGAPVPGVYTLIEAVMGLLFVLCYLKFGFSEPFLLITFGMTTFMMLPIMLSQDDFFSNRTLIACFTLGMVYRTLLDGTIYGFAGGAFTALMIGAMAWKLAQRTLPRDITSFPTELKMLVACGIWLPLAQLLIVILIVLLEMPLARQRPYVCEWTMSFCVILFTLTRIGS